MKSETKVCSRCKEPLPLSAFGTHKKRSGNGKVYDFRRNVCKGCYSDYETDRKKRNGSKPYQQKPYSQWSDAKKRAAGDFAREHRAKVKGLPVGFTARDWEAALKYFDYKCAYCGDHLTVAEQEHYVPVAKGGGYVRNNIIPACRACNLKKRDKSPIEWLVTLPNSLVAYARIMIYFMQVSR
jgi:5-methylcytosine-specific restriction endonuclease McrA